MGGGGVPFCSGQSAANPRQEAGCLGTRRKIRATSRSRVEKATLAGGCGTILRPQARGCPLGVNAYMLCRPASVKNMYVQSEVMRWLRHAMNEERFDSLPGSLPVRALDFRTNLAGLSGRKPGDGKPGRQTTRGRGDAAGRAARVRACRPPGRLSGRAAASQGAPPPPPAPRAPPLPQTPPTPPPRPLSAPQPLPALIGSARRLATHCSSRSIQQQARHLPYNLQSQHGPCN